MKKVIIVNTSPRPKGNCAAISWRLQTDFADAEVEYIVFRDAKIGFCLACDACKKKDAVWCIQDDDMSALLPELDACDALVLLAPIYQGELCAQAMTFANRLYAFRRRGKGPEMYSVASRTDKKAAVIITCGAPADIYLDKAEAMAERVIAGAGFSETRALGFGLLDTPGCVAGQESSMAEVDALASWLMA